MKRVLTVLASAALTAAVLAGCGSGGEDSLVSKTAFPEFDEVDMEGNPVTSDIFAGYDATIVNFWNNGCGSCVAEMPELEELYQDFQERNINLIGVGTDSGESDEPLDTAREILAEKGVTYTNISPDPDCGYFHLSHHLYRRQRGKHCGRGHCRQCKKTAGHRGGAAGVDPGGAWILTQNRRLGQRALRPARRPGRSTSLHAETASRAGEDMRPLRPSRLLINPPSKGFGEGA